MNDIEVKNKPTHPDEEEDLYGEQLPPAQSLRTPTSKKRKTSNSTATPVSTKSKSSPSAVFSPAETLDTPATSISSSIRKVNSALRNAKRKLEEIKCDIEESEAEESDFRLSDEESEEDEVEDSVSIAPTVSSAEANGHAGSTTHVVRRRGVNRRRAHFNQPKPRVSQWQKTNMELIRYHPELACIWDELDMSPTIIPVAVPQPEGLSLQLLPFQLEGLDWLLKQEQQARFGGGILADEMGMGKTIQTIALLLAEPRGKPNLVVAPTVALMQWKTEIETHTNNGLSVCLFYGGNRTVTAKELVKYDVVLTTCMVSRYFC